jgi:colanic acid biosynthesis glycosyl transferase WcaI
MSNVLLVTTNYWPEPTGTAPFATDLAIALTLEGNFVSVVTTFPHYPWWSIPSQYQGMQNLSHGDDGISIFRTRHYIPKTSNLITRLMYELSLLKNLMQCMKRIETSNMDYVVTIGSSFAGHFIGKKFAKQKKIPLLIIIHDLIGKGLEQSGIPGGKIISKLVQSLEVSNLKEAYGIAVISPAMQSALEEMGVEPGKISFLPTYSTSSIPELETAKAKLANGWDPNTFAVVHSGNMGNKQHLETLIDAAKILSSESDIAFFLVGHGNQEARLKTLAKGVKNLHFVPAVKDEDFPNVLGGADLLLVSERASQLDMSLPSKLTSYFFSNRPVIASVPIGGATAQYLAGLAQIVPAEKPKLLAEELISMKKNQTHRSLLAANALTYARLNLNKENGRQRYIDWVIGVTRM